MAKIGTSEWFTEVADRCIGTGLDVLKAKMLNVDDTGGSNPAYVSASTGVSKFMPYVLGAAVLGGIVLIMRKR